MAGNRREAYIDSVNHIAENKELQYGTPGITQCEGISFATIALEQLGDRLQAAVVDDINFRKIQHNVTPVALLDNSGKLVVK